VFGPLIIMPPRPSETFGDFRLGSGHSVSRSSGSVAALDKPRQRASPLQPAIRCRLFVRVRATAKWWCVTSGVPFNCISGYHSEAVEINSVTWFS
jgi:hypothetical protein